MNPSVLKLNCRCQPLVFIRSIYQHNQSWRILFFGSDHFSLYSLKQLHNCLKSKQLVSALDVVTTTSNRPNSVQRFALDNSINIYSWPPSLEAADKAYDVGIVVSFGHLIPKKIISHFPLGMMNVHASLLPRWRGASPIIHSILSGETTTGISVMRINPHHFDTGDILLQKSCSIGPDELMPSLHERLGRLGATGLLESLAAFPDAVEKSVPQNNDAVSYAPRIKSDIAIVRWEEQTSYQVYNLYRALFTVYDLRTSWHGVPIKLKKLGVIPGERKESRTAGTVEWHRSSKLLCVLCQPGTVVIDALSIGGKSLRGVDFYNGYLSKRPESEWFFK